MACKQKEVEKLAKSFQSAFSSQEASLLFKISNTHVKSSQGTKLAETPEQNSMNKFLSCKEIIGENGMVGRSLKLKFSCRKDSKDTSSIVMEGNTGTPNESNDFDQAPLINKKQSLSLINLEESLVPENVSTQHHVDIMLHNSEVNLAQATSNTVMKGDGELGKKRKKKWKRARLYTEKSQKLQASTHEELKKLKAAAKELIEGNNQLKSKMLSLSENCSELKEENQAIVAELIEKHGRDAVPNLETLTPEEVEEIAGKVASQVKRPQQIQELR